MSWRIRLSLRAEHDLDRILAYSAKTFGTAQTQVYAETLRLAVAELFGGPEALGSSSRDDLMPGLRMLRVGRRGRRGRHVLLYRARPGDRIEVLRILHEAMDPSRHIHGVDTGP